MQNRDGGWAAFDIDNDAQFLNDIPFSDMDSLCDPSSPDVAGRVLEALGILDDPQYRGRVPPGRRVPAPLAGAGGELVRALGRQLRVRHVERAERARAPARARLGPDGRARAPLARGGAERGRRVGRGARVLRGPRAHGAGPSTRVADGVGRHGAPRLPPGRGRCGARAGSRGSWSASSRAGDAAGSWDEEEFTGTGFPRHFYLRYHLYRHYFPLMALGRFCAQRVRERHGARADGGAALGHGRPPTVRLRVPRVLPRVRGAPARLAQDAHVRGRDLAPRVRRRVQLDAQRLPVRPVPLLRRDAHARAVDLERAVLGLAVVRVPLLLLARARRRAALARRGARPRLLARAPPPGGAARSAARS